MNLVPQNGSCPNGKICILPKTNIAPENWWLEDDSFPFWDPALFQRRLLLIFKECFFAKTWSPQLFAAANITAWAKRKITLKSW